MLVNACFNFNLQHNRGTKLSKSTGFSITSAERYSLALYELSKESSLLTQTEEQCSSVLALINSSEDFRNLIKDPTTKKDDLLKVNVDASINGETFSRWTKENVGCLLYTSPSPRDS